MTSWMNVTTQVKEEKEKEYVDVDVDALAEKVFQKLQLDSCWVQQLCIDGQAIQKANNLVKKIAGCAHQKVMWAVFRMSSYGPLELRSTPRSRSPDIRYNVPAGGCAYPIIDPRPHSSGRG